MKKNIFNKKLTLKDFANLFGTTVGNIPKDCKDLISKTDFSYKKLEQAKRDNLILEMFKRIESGEFSVAGKKKQPRWQSGWQEVLNDFANHDYNVNNLMPQYDRKPGAFLRLNSDYVAPKNPMFEMEWLNIFRRWFFKEYLGDVDNIFEFGCGTGQNLVVLAKLFPKKNLYGSEWVKSSLGIIKLLAKKHNYNIKGHLFDFFSPDQTLNFPPNTAVLTRAALEQVGSNHDKFLKFLLKKSPDLVVNIEPIIELYDENNLIDYLGIKFQKKRNYLDGYLSSLYKLKDEGKIEIIKVKRVPFGSVYLDPYSYVIWKPKRHIKK